MDPELMFECLIYLNMYYYVIFAICEIIMALAKYGTGIQTPFIDQDAGVLSGVLFAELWKILLYRRFKETRRDLITGICVALTGVSIGGIAYTFMYQCPLLKLEMILNIMQAMLAVTEIVFGTLQIVPCYQKKQYY